MSRLVTRVHPEATARFGSIGRPLLHFRSLALEVIAMPLFLNCRSTMELFAPSLFLLVQHLNS